MASWQEVIKIFLSVLEKLNFDFVLGALIAVISGYIGAKHASVLQAKRDDLQVVRDIASLRKALRAEINDLWETYRESVGHKVAEHDFFKPYSPERGYTPNLGNCPVLKGVSPKIGLMNPQELSWVNRTYAHFSQLQYAFEKIEARRFEQETKPLGHEIRGYNESLLTRLKHALQDMQTCHTNAAQWADITLKLLDRPLDELGNPVGPGPFEDDAHQPESE